jgi:perosamine synthetase
MKMTHRINLIPRNNWDYRFSALFSAIGSINKRSFETPNVENLFHQSPIWTNSGRTSLYAILKSLGLPEGANVGVPLFCCSVVFNAIRQAGYQPYFLDSNISDCNISIGDLHKKRPDLDAVVAVHMFGNPCDMDQILNCAGPIPVIEDCAQSIFSTYQGKQTGLLSTASFFSFRCGKYISAGEGSAIFCGDAELHKKIERIVDSFDTQTSLSMLKDAFLTFLKASLYNRPLYGLIGYPIGMKLDNKLNLTAKDGFETGKIASTHLTLIESRIGNFEKNISIQKEHARSLLEALTSEKFALPDLRDGLTGNWFQFPLRFATTAQRDQMADYLLNQGIDTSRYLDDIADEARIDYGYAGDCPKAELLSKTILLIPIHYKLGKSDLEHIAEAINNGSRRI